MSITYTPATNFGAKDSLPTNDPDKVIKGVDFTTEFSAIQTAFTLAAPVASPTFTGTVTIPTADINGGNIDGTVIGAATPAAGSFTTGQFDTSLNVDGTVTADGLTVAGDISVTGGNRTLLATHHLNIDIDSDNNNTDRIFYVTNDGETKTRFVVGESGDISFYEDTGTTPQFFWDASEESLGLGTASPSFTAGNKGIHIADATSPAIRLQDTDNANSDFTIYSPDGDNSLRFYHQNSATDFVSITSLGEVGIGTTTPSYTLEVGGEAVASQGMPYIAESTTARTLALTDSGNYIRCTNSGATTVTIPPNSSVAFPTGAEVIIFQAGAGQVTIAAGAGVTLNSKEGNLKISAQYAAVTCKKVATDTWDVIGDLSA